MYIGSLGFIITFVMLFLPLIDLASLGHFSHRGRRINTGRWFGHYSRAGEGLVRDVSAGRSSDPSPARE
jgi:hypothetical protein